MEHNRVGKSTVGYRYLAGGIPIELEDGLLHIGGGELNAGQLSSHLASLPPTYRLLIISVAKAKIHFQLNISLGIQQKR